jgi:hypothetical protein
LVASCDRHGSGLWWLAVNSFAALPLLLLLLLSASVRATLLSLEDCHPGIVELLEPREQCEHPRPIPRFRSEWIAVQGSDLQSHQATQWLNASVAVTIAVCEIL